VEIGKKPDGISRQAWCAGCDVDDAQKKTVFPLPKQNPQNRILTPRFMFLDSKSQTKMFERLYLVGNDYLRSLLAMGRLCPDQSQLDRLRCSTKSSRLDCDCNYSFINTGNYFMFEKDVSTMTQWASCFKFLIVGNMQRVTDRSYNFYTQYLGFGWLLTPAADGCFITSFAKKFRVILKFQLLTLFVVFVLQMVV